MVANAVDSTDFYCEKVKCMLCELYLVVLRLSCHRTKHLTEQPKGRRRLLTPFPRKTRSDSISGVQSKAAWPHALSRESWQKRPVVKTLLCLLGDGNRRWGSGLTCEPCLGWLPAARSPLKFPEPTAQGQAFNIHSWRDNVLYLNLLTPT